MLSLRALGYSPLAQVVEVAANANARRAPRVAVPSTGDYLAIVEYEEAIAVVLLTTLKRSERPGNMILLTWSYDVITG